MSMEQAVGFLVFALVAAVTPGPSNIMLTAVGAQAGVVPPDTKPQVQALCST
jgi:threonine/homoserine/homoserine lactone efflux protein